MNLLARPGEPGEGEGHGRGFEQRLHLRRYLIAHVVVDAHEEEQGVHALIPRHGFARRLERLALGPADHQGYEVDRVVLGRVVGQNACEFLLRALCEDGECKARLGRQIALGRLDRPEDALAAYDEVVRRFGDSEMPALLESVARALVRKGFILGRLNRLEDVLATCDEVVRRFGDSDVSALLESVARALVCKGHALEDLDRLEDVLTTCDEVVRRFGDSEMPALLESVAEALVSRGFTLGRLNRTEDAVATFDEVVHRFGNSKSPAFRRATECALLIKADFDIECQRYKAAIEAAGRVLDMCHTESSVNRRLAYLIRAKASLASGDMPAGERDIAAILTILPDFDSLPKESLEELMEFSIDIGPERMVELIQASPSVNLLLPLTTALEQELGREPRVALEVAEVAADIRKDLAKLRETQSDGVE